MVKESDYRQPKPGADYYSGNDNDQNALNVVTETQNFVRQEYEE